MRRTVAALWARTAIVTCTRPVPPFVAQLACPPAQQAGNDTLDHGAAVAGGAGQLHLAGGAFAVQARGGEHRVNLRGGRRGRERLDRAGDTHSEDVTGMQGLPQFGVVERQIAGERVDRGSGPRGDVRERRLHLVHQRHDVAAITGIAHRQLRGEHEACGGLADNPRLAAKLGGAVTLAFADRGDGGIVGIDDFTAGQGLAVGEATGLGSDLLMGDEGESQRGVPARPLVCRQRGGGLDLRLGSLRHRHHGLPRRQQLRFRLPDQLTKTFPAHDTAAQTDA